MKKSLVKLLKKDKAAAGKDAKPTPSAASGAKGALLIDARSKPEYDMQHVNGAINIPVQNIARKIGKVTAYTIEDLGARLCKADALLHPPRYVMREFHVAFGKPLVGILLATERRIGRMAGSPDLVGLANAVSGIAQCERVRRHAAVPDSRFQDGAAPGVKEMTTTHQRGAGRRARRCTGERVAKDRTLARNTINVRCVQNPIDTGPCVDIGVRASVASPVVGENKQNVPARRIGRRILLLGRTGDNRLHCEQQRSEGRQESVRHVRQSRIFTRMSL